jgi:hypothetical protein
MLVESYWWNHELVELFWWYHTGEITASKAFWSEAHPHVSLTQIWLRDMNSSTVVSHPFAGGIILVVSYWWNHRIRCPQTRAASPCSVNPHLVAGHELFHDCQPSILLLKKYAHSK